MIVILNVDPPAFGLVEGIEEALRAEREIVHTHFPFHGCRPRLRHADILEEGSDKEPVGGEKVGVAHVSVHAPKILSIDSNRRAKESSGSHHEPGFRWNGSVVGSVEPRPWVGIGPEEFPIPESLDGTRGGNTPPIGKIEDLSAA